jgi:hypothetical protein
LDNPFGAEGQCCEADPDYVAPVESGAAIMARGFTSAFMAVFVVVNVYVF